ncbi:MAG: ferritin family protein [Chlorobi bacterium]|nr:ferritin family protein [Chlorobiota bacterium]
MEESKTLEILKTAILLERRGKAFYSQVADQTKDEDVKNIFNLMAKEEDEHIHFLTEQFESYVKTQAFKITKLHKEEDSIAEQILSDNIKKNISAASFEAAAISSAIDMENRAIAVYTERAENATDEEEKKFYQWLANWEKGHHKLLFELDKELKEKIWNDNSFWPF